MSEQVSEHLIYMKISFKFRSTKRKPDKYQELLIRVINGRSFDKLICTGLYLNKKYWKDTENYVSDKHPNAIDYNDKIKLYHDRIFEGKHKFESGRFTAQTLVSYLKGEARYDSLDAYVESVMKDVKSDQNIEGYRDNLKRFKRLYGVNRPIKFEDLANDTYSIFERVHTNAQKLVLDESVRFSKTTYTQMIMHVGAICNHAHNRGYFRDKITIPSDFKKVKGDTQRIVSHTPEDVLNWIKEIKTIQQWESVAFWILMFSMRGLYQADIVKLSDKNLKDKNKKSRSKYLSDFWRDNLYYYHPRSKTHEKMYIKIFRQPILLLIQALKNVVTYNHMPYHPEAIASINDKIAIYDYDPTSDKKYHQSIWATKMRTMREKFGTNYKTARKTFATQCADKFPQTITLILMGRKGDRILHDSYIDILDDKMIEKVEQAHLDVLEGFRMKDIITSLWDKLRGLISTQNHPMWVLMNSGAFKHNGKYQIYLGTNEEGEVLKCDITKGYEKYFKADITKTDDYWQDDKEQLEYFKEEEEKRIKENVSKIMKEGHPLLNELKKQKEIEEQQKDLDNYLTEIGIEVSK